MKNWCLIILIALSVIIGSPLFAEDSSAETKKLYESAVLLYGEKKYELARTVFQQILLHHPQSDLADNALYWKGISYYDERKYELALKELEKLLKDYPQGNKAEDARSTIKKIKKIQGALPPPEKKGLRELIRELERELSDKKYLRIP